MELTVKICEKKITDELIKEATRYVMRAFSEPVSWRLSHDDKEMLSTLSGIVRKIYADTMETPEFRAHLAGVVREAIAEVAKEKSKNWAKKQTVDALAKTGALDIEVKP